MTSNNAVKNNSEEFSRTEILKENILQGKLMASLISFNMVDNTYHSYLSKEPT